MLALIAAANVQAKQMLDSHPRQPAIIHALDPTLFTPELCATLDYCQAQNQLLAGHSAIWGLYWVRRFYEHSDGNDYNQVGQNIPFANLDAWLRNGDYFSKSTFVVQMPSDRWFPPLVRVFPKSAAPRYTFTPEYFDRELRWSAPDS